MTRNPILESEAWDIAMRPGGSAVTEGAPNGYRRGTSPTLIGHCGTPPGHRLLSRISSLLPSQMLVVGTRERFGRPRVFRNVGYVTHRAKLCPEMTLKRSANEGDPTVMTLQSMESPAEKGAPWCAVYTRHQHEKSIGEMLEAKGFEVFLPLYESTRRWKDRRKVLSLTPVSLLRFCARSA